jgi:hypothetical protein
LHFIFNLFNCFIDLFKSADNRFGLAAVIYFCKNYLELIGVLIHIRRFILNVDYGITIVTYSLKLLYNLYIKIYILTVERIPYWWSGFFLFRHSEIRSSPFVAVNNKERHVFIILKQMIQKPLWIYDIFFRLIQVRYNETSFWLR